MKRETNNFGEYIATDGVWSFYRPAEVPGPVYNQNMLPSHTPLPRQRGYGNFPNSYFTASESAASADTAPNGNTIAEHAVGSAGVGRTVEIESVPVVAEPVGIPQFAEQVADRRLSGMAA